MAQMALIQAEMAGLPEKGGELLASIQPLLVLSFPNLFSAGEGDMRGIGTLFWCQTNSAQAGAQPIMQ